LVDFRPLWFDRNDRDTMLQDIGDKLKGTGQSGGKGHRWIWYSILAALILVFALWGPYTLNLSFGQASYAAKVNGEEISAEQINREWQEQLPGLIQAHGGELADLQREILQQQLLDGAVRGLAITQYAKKLGYGVSRARLSQAIQDEEAFKIDGKYNAQAAQARLAAAGMTEQRYVDERRKDLLTNQLLGSVGVSNFFTAAEGKRILSLLDEERELRYVVLQPQDFEGREPVAQDAIESWYQAHTDQFTVPEAVKLAYAELSVADVAAAVKVTDQQLRARYEQDKATYQRPETRRASHILIAVNDPSEDEGARDKAEGLYAQIKAGADFARLARENSADTGSAANGGDLGWAGREVYVKEFADKLFSMKKEGEVGEPVKTEFGYHIIRLDGIRASEGRSFEDVRAELTAALRNEETAKLFGDRQDELQERLEAGGTTLDELVKELGMRRGEVPRFERGNGGLPLGSDPELNREVFSDTSLTQRRVAGPLPLGEDRMVVFQVLDHMPASTRPLDQVRAEVVAGIRRELGIEAAHAAAEAALADLAAGKSFGQVAARLKGKVQGPLFAGRGSPDVPAALRDALFAADRPEPGKPVRQVINTGDGVALFEATGWRTQALSDNPQLIQLRTDRELRRYTRRDIEAYMDDVVSSAKVRTNPQVFQQ
jgi:peptidyl-prolyl cis-trans isomerase D